MPLQKDFTKKDIKQKLEGYKEVAKKDLEFLPLGTRIRYRTNNEFRAGGVIKTNRYPDYLVLMNTMNGARWCMQIKTDPTLIVYKKDSDIEEQKNIIFEQYKRGHLVPKKGK